MLDCTYKIHGLAPRLDPLADVVFARKKNQAKGEVVARRKAKGDEIVREMYVLKALFKTYIYSPLHQTPSFIVVVLPV